MKLAITGKGGVGKTTLSSTLARLYAHNKKLYTVYVFSVFVRDIRNLRIELEKFVGVVGTCSLLNKGTHL